MNSLSDGCRSRLTRTWMIRLSDPDTWWYGRLLAGTDGPAWIGLVDLVIFKGNYLCSICIIFNQLLVHTIIHSCYLTLPVNNGIL